MIALVTGSSYRSCGQPPVSQARHTASASAGLLTREDAGPGRRAAYSLTEASIQLVPVFAQLGEWGLHHRPTKKRLRVRAELLTAGGPELWREFMAELRTIHVGEPR